MVAGMSPAFLLGILGVGLTVGVLSCLFGVGGGFLLTPMMNIVLDLPYNLAVGTSIFSILATPLVGAVRHLRLGNVDPKLGLLMVLAAIPS